MSADNFNTRGFWIEHRAAKAREAAQGLIGAFDFSESKEGHDYWYAIYERLLEIAKDANEWLPYADAE